MKKANANEIRRKKGFKGIFKAETVAMMFEKFMDAINEALEKVDSIHVNIMKGNRKTGKLVKTLSRVPLCGCPGCALNGMCPYYCYDARTCNRFSAALKKRAENSAIARTDRARYWHEATEIIKAKKIKALRLKVGGDLVYEDLPYIAEMIKETGVHVIVFTENHEVAIRYDIENEIDLEHLHLMLSGGTEKIKYNPNGLPECYIDNGSGYLPKTYVRCPCKSCSHCFETGTGCFALKRGDSMVLDAH